MDGWGPKYYIRTPPYARADWRALGMIGWALGQAMDVVAVGGRHVIGFRLTVVNVILHSTERGKRAFAGLPAVVYDMGGGVADL